MSITGLDPEKCQQRNRIAAKRDGIDSIPVRLFRQSTPPVGDETDLLYAHGTLPSTPEAALERINALLPADAPPLTPDDVYLHYIEAANDNYVSDRYMFLAQDSLRNFAQDAQAGVALMNSHRTGGLSHPSELPYGRTFAGRYEQTKAGRGRTLIGFYMLKGVYPNGQSGPSTDDLHRMILGGTTFDVSIGLSELGQVMCDVCQNELESADCPHVPGTTHSMTPAERQAQQARGVRRGEASYTRHDAHMNEVSPVFDGAVPGAGFRKTLSLARRRQLTPVELAQARHAYAALLSQGDLNMDEISDAVQNGFTRALKSLGFRQEPETHSEANILADAVTELKPVTVPDPEIERQLAAEQAKSAALAAQVVKLAEQGRIEYIESLVRSGRLLPARKPWALQKLAQAAADDAALPDAVAFVAPDGTARTGSRVEAVKAELEAAPAHHLTEETIKAGALFAVGATALDQEKRQTAEAEQERLLAQTELGREVLAALKGGK